MLQVIALGSARWSVPDFCLLGQTALIMQSATWIAFACGGLVALFAGYAYAGYPPAIPRRAVLLIFPAVIACRADDRLILLYLVTLILTVAMVARAFSLRRSAFHPGK